MAYNPQAREVELLRKNLDGMEPLSSMLSVAGKVAIVTGGTSGLGFNITARLLEGGANVVIASDTEYSCDNAIGLLRERGYGEDRVVACITDVRDEDAVANLVSFTDKTFGSIDILVTSAAKWSYAHIYDMPEEEFAKVIDINLNGTFRAIKHVSKYMIEKEIAGKMCLISSDSAWLPYPTFGGYPHYVASKGGVNALGLEAAKELKRFGIMVNVVAPGAMQTNGAVTTMVVEDIDEDAQDELYA
ncbi:MAG: SDR family NAD(P)-dependent oxidoreductase, partial [Atopobiaceae bacterium]|nr:SDR family NAD(P)-dependent oxidoreductase [Atopobiaceae bacterium]